MTTQEYDLSQIAQMMERIRQQHPNDRSVRDLHTALGTLQSDYVAISREAFGKLQSIVQPPNTFGVYLGPSPTDDERVIIGASGRRAEALLPDDLDISELRQGQELVLSGQTNGIIEKRQTVVIGEVAEVANILKPQGTVEIVSVHEHERLSVRLREGQDPKDVSIGPDLRGLSQQLKPGMLVRVDETETEAIALERPRLHVRRGGGEGEVVEVSDDLNLAGVQIGTMVRYDALLKFAFEKVLSNTTSKLTLEGTPKVTYEDVGGLGRIVEQVRDAIELPYLYRDEYKRYQISRPKGILLYGPPGCGKTMIAKAIARGLTDRIREHLKRMEPVLLLYHELQARPPDVTLIQRVRDILPTIPNGLDTNGMRAQLRDYLAQYDIDPERPGELERIRPPRSSKEEKVRAHFLNIKGPALLSKWVGETERQIREIFEDARRRATFNTPVIIFFDEMEALFRTRGSGRSSDVETTIVPQFLAEIDGVESTENVLVVGASNRDDMIDPAFLRPGRLDIKIEIPRPNPEGAREILALSLLPTLPLDRSGAPISQGDISQIVFRTAYREIPQIAALLPENSDVRLALSVSDEELVWLGKLVEQNEAITVLQARELAGAPQFSKFLYRLRAFRATTPVREIVTKCQHMRAQRAGSATLSPLLQHYAQQEWLAEKMIDRCVKMLYSENSLLVIQTNDSPLLYRVYDFINGAILESIVRRAKFVAMKRSFRGWGQAAGISLADVESAVRDEFEESKRQLALYKVQIERKQEAESIQAVDIFWEGEREQRFVEKKVRPYQRRAPAVPAAPAS